MNNESHGNDGKKGSDGRHTSHSTHESHQPIQRPIIQSRGDYQTLLSFQKAEVVYDITFRFAQKFLSKGDRTVDQMIQSARSGKQNILEGSKAATTSKETEIKLTNVGRASLEELLADYRDYLRVREHQIWDKDSREARYVRDLGRRSPQTFELYREFVQNRPADVIANIAICLIHQTNYLLDQQLKTLEKEFIEQGGLRERMTKARLNYRNQNRGQELQSSGKNRIYGKNKTPSHASPQFPFFPAQFQSTNENSREFRGCFSGFVTVPLTSNGR